MRVMGWCPISCQYPAKTQLQFRRSNALSTLEAPALVTYAGGAAAATRDGAHLQQERRQWQLCGWRRHACTHCYASVDFCWIVRLLSTTSCQHTSISRLRRPQRGIQALQCQAPVRLPSYLKELATGIRQDNNTANAGRWCTEALPAVCI